MAAELRPPKPDAGSDEPRIIRWHTREIAEYLKLLTKAVNDLSGFRPVQLYGATVGATTGRLTTDGAAPTGFNVPTLPDATGYRARGWRLIASAEWTGGSSGAVGDCASWDLSALLARTSGSSTTVLVGGGGASLSPSFSRGAGSAWRLSVTADTTLDALNVSGVGAVGNDVSWRCLLLSPDPVYSLAAGAGGTGFVPPPSPTISATHWQLFFLGTWDDAVSIAELAVAATAGGPNIISTATVTGSGGSWTNFANITNGNAADFGTNLTVNGSSIQIAFASATTLREVRITARNDAFSPQAPAAFVVRASTDGGVTYQTVAWCVTSTYTAGQTKSFSFTPAPVGLTRANARAWRCWVTATQVGPSTALRCGELYMATSTGGASVTTGGAPIFATTQPNADRGFKAFDNDTSAGNEYMSQSIAGPHMIGYAFAAPQDLAEIRWAAGGYGPGDLPDNPASMQFQWTADGVNWNTTDTYSGIAAWPSIGFTRSYSVSP